MREIVPLVEVRALEWQRLKLPRSSEVHARIRVRVRARARVRLRVRHRLS